MGIKIFSKYSRLWTVGAILLLGTAGAARAWGRADKPQRTGFAHPDIQPVKVELITEYASIQPGGSTWVGLHFDIAEGWHIYAPDNPGDAGIPTAIEWTVPNDASMGPLVFPRPKEFVDPGDIHTFGYDGSVVLASTLRSPASQGSASEIPITAKVKWLACKALCVPGSAQLELSLPVSPGPHVPSTHAEFFAHTE